MAVKLLMPLVSSVVDVPCRMEAYALVWEQVVEEEMLPNGEGSGLTGAINASINNSILNIHKNE